MKNIILILAVAASALSCAQEKAKDFSKETLAYELTTPDQGKTTFKDILKKHKDKKTVIEIWAGWCSDCVKAMPKVKELQAANPDVDYVFISMDKSFDKWKEAVAKHDVKGDLYWVDDAKMMKGAFGQSIDLDWIPRYIVVDKKGKVVIYRAIETDFDKIDTALKTK